MLLIDVLSVDGLPNFAYPFKYKVFVRIEYLEVVKDLRAKRDPTEFDDIQFFSIAPNMSIGKNKKRLILSIMSRESNGTVDCICSTTLDVTEMRKNDKVHRVQIKLKNDEIAMSRTNKEVYEVPE